MLFINNIYFIINRNVCSIKKNKLSKNEINFNFRIAFFVERYFETNERIKINLTYVDNFTISNNCLQQRNVAFNSFIQFAKHRTN